jgi:hypothetical protein
MARVPAVARVSSVPAFPTAVQVSSAAAGVSNILGGPCCCLRPYGC